MTSSEHIDKLAAALVAAQSEVENPKMDSKGGPPKNNKYASLHAVRAAVLPVFARHGLAVVQAAGTGQGGPTVTTLLVHSSGQWMDCGTLTVPAAKQDAQSYGSALTYGRRYALQAVTGVVGEEDDDGAAASAPARQRQAAPAPAPAKANGQAAPPPPVLASAAQVEEISTLLERTGTPEETVRGWLAQLGVEDIADAPADAVARAISKLKDRVAATSRGAR